MNLLKSFPTTKEGVENAANKIITEVKEGRVDALKAKVLLTAMEKIIALAKDEIAGDVLAECDKYKEKTFSTAGAEISVSTRTSYEYDHCNDWLELKVQKGVIEEKMKAIQKQLQVADKNGYLDRSTGELIESPCPTKITRVVSVKLK